MSPRDLLHAHGVQVVLSAAGDLRLAGLGALDPDQAKRMVEHAKANRAEILAEVEAEHPARRYAQRCPKYWSACFQCPDAALGSLYFCKKFRSPDGGWK